MCVVCVCVCILCALCMCYVCVCMQCAERTYTHLCLYIHVCMHAQTIHTPYMLYIIHTILSMTQCNKSFASCVFY